jgi:hypothetical protein
VKTEAEFGVVQAKGCLDLPGFGRGSIRAFGKNVVLLSWLLTSGFQNRGEVNCHCFKVPRVWSFVTAALGN